MGKEFDEAFVSFMKSQTMVLRQCREIECEFLLDVDEDLPKCGKANSSLLNAKVPPKRCVHKKTIQEKILPDVLTL